MKDDRYQGWIERFSDGKEGLSKEHLKEMVSGMLSSYETGVEPSQADVDRITGIIMEIAGVEEDGLMQLSDFHGLIDGNHVLLPALEARDEALTHMDHESTRTDVDRMKVELEELRSTVKRQQEEIDGINRHIKRTPGKKPGDFGRAMNMGGGYA